jgi:hypothetical protein
MGVHIQATGDRRQALTRRFADNTQNAILAILLAIFFFLQELNIRGKIFFLTRTIGYIDDSFYLSFYFFLFLVEFMQNTATIGE